MDLIITFILGIVGALAPETIRLYSIRNNPSEFQWSWFYLAVSILFAFLGGVIAIILPATNYLGALYAGISTPIVINTAFKKGVELSKPEFKGSFIPTRKNSLFKSFIKGL